ncbi:MAG TPA: caspase family protein [Tenuifilaceae bacterium]|nr:caspase family protein [Tenuifilaceae bacterium]
MKHLKVVPLVLCWLVVFVNNLSGQLSLNARIDRVDVRFDDKIFIPYSIANGKESDRYVVWVEFFNEKNQPIQAKSLQGDVNIVKGNGDKLISWDAKSDGVLLNEKISVKVNAKLLPEANTGKAFAYSTLFPGAGQYQFKGGKPHWLKGALAYALVGSSIGTYSLALNSFDKYVESGIHSSQDPNYATAKSYQTTSLILAGVGLGIWIWDYVGIISNSTKYKHPNPQTIIYESGYKQYAASSPQKHINMRGMPPVLYADLDFKDGNENGLLDAGEDAILNVTLSNEGSGDAMNLQIDVSSNFKDGSLKIENASQDITVLKAGERKKISFPIATDLDLKSASHKLTITVKEQYGYDMDPAFLLLNTYAYQPPKFVVSGYEILDTGYGTQAIISDGKLQAGERVKIKLVLQNIGLSMATGSKYKITTSDENLYIEDIEGLLGDVKPGEVKELYFTLSPNKRVVSKENLPIFLSVTEEIGRGNLKNERLPIALDRTPPTANIVEVKPDPELVKKVARFEYTSNKFRANYSNVINIKTIAPSQTKRENSVGVLIGVSKYKELPPAPYSDNDAKIMKDYFERVLGVEQVILFTNDDVSGFFFDDIFNPELGELQKAVVKGETEVFVYYSGHGVPDKDGKNIFLFPSDGKISRLDNQGYNIEKLYENLKRLEAKHVTVILDACFSGSSRSTESVSTENLIGQKGVKVRPKYSWVGDPMFTVISSSTGEETSLGFDESETGLFTYYLAAGLSGEADSNKDKVITLGELKEYVIRNVKETSTKISGLQTPMFYGDDNKELVRY